MPGYAFGVPEGQLRGSDMDLSKTRLIESVFAATAKEVQRCALSTGRQWFCAHC